MIIKICGITRAEDAEAAVRHGATAVGFVFWPKSPRYVAPEAARAIIERLPPHVLRVGVFVDARLDEARRQVATSGVNVAQLHGQELPEYAAALECSVWKAMDVDGCTSDEQWTPDVPILLDAIDPVARGGTGLRVDWTRASACARRRRVILAGGLTPENVQAAVDAVHPGGVDVSSGVERTPGIKDEAKIERFIGAARRAFAAFETGQARGATA